MSKYGIQSPVYRKATTAEVIGSIVINLVVGIATTALGIHMYNEKKAARKESEGK